MPSRLVYAFSVTVPAGTAQNAGWSQQIDFPDAVVDRIEIAVPPGPRGLVGFSLGSSGTAVIPFNAGAWIVANDEKMAWDLEGQFDSGAWQMFAYNLGRFAHTINVRFLVSLPGPRSFSPVLLSNAALSTLSP